MTKPKQRNGKSRKEKKEQSVIRKASSLVANPDRELNWHTGSSQIARTARPEPPKRNLSPAFKNRR